MSQADKIRELLHLSNHLVAERLGWPLEEKRLAYIRAVRQRTSRSGNPIRPPTQRNWEAKNPERVRATRRRSYHRMKHAA